MGGDGAFGVLAQRRYQVLSGTGDLTLGKRPDGHDVKPASQRLRGGRQRVVTGGAGQDSGARKGALPVEACLDRV